MKQETEMIMMDSPEAATRKTVTGWVSRDGFFYGDNESTARYAGATHRRCEGEGCTEVIGKTRMRSEACEEKRLLDLFYSRPAEPWDGKGMLYSDRFDDYTVDPEEFLQERNDEIAERNEERMPGDAEEALLTIEDCRFKLCKKTIAWEIDPQDIYEGDLPEDGDVDKAVQEAFDTLNAKLRELQSVLSWFPREVRWDGTMKTD